MSVFSFLFILVCVSFGLGGIIGYRFGCDRTRQKTYDIIDKFKSKEE